ncbi:MAG: hypothetical protein CPDRYMAC_4022 [uncultured Paraburkholderia sp.]|nr:MAG: hypothetical protein CPDRYMAC_4022 [uncultured Paraburkholderia sp.]
MAAPDYSGSLVNVMTAYSFIEEIVTAGHSATATSSRRLRASAVCQPFSSSARMRPATRCTPPASSMRS